MSGNETVARWIPRDDVLCLAAGKLDAAQARLEDLSDLNWPNPTEHIELKVLARWLRPPHIILEELILVVVAQTYNYVGPKNLPDELTLVGQEVYGNLKRLENGDKLLPCRPEPPEDPEEIEAWRKLRQQQARGWFAGCMWQLDHLLEGDIASIYDLLPLVHPALRHQMRYEIAREIIDDGYAVGASLFLEPIEGMPGASLGKNAVHVGDAIAHAVKLLVEEIDKATTPSLETLSHLDFLWCVLKGFVWAGCLSPSIGLSLPSEYSSSPDSWALVKESLETGLKRLSSPGARHKLPSHGTARSSAPIQTPTSHLITKMERYIEEATASASRIVR